jgi:haloacetate dehalogenase
MAPQLAKKFTVVMTDLRGYGDSSKPPGGDDHYGYSKRAMSDDQIEVMTALGHERFAVIGHDRGGRVAHRMALDHANRVDRLAVIDIVPTRKVYESVDRVVATQYFHWFFLIQNAPFPETLINNNPETWLENFGQTPAIVGQDCYAEYLRCFKNPATVHAICEDYRAGASIDLEHDASDLDKKISCPLFVLWGAKGLLPHYDVLATWSERAAQVSGKELPGGHWLPERLPAETLAALETFLDA